ncbi:MAG: hypothetical protein P8H94_07115 [Crocinitomicaceae bacterium]|nr:hypothetical protein [Crocinitomicaceae bacterium]
MKNTFISNVLIILILVCSCEDKPAHSGQAEFGQKITNEAGILDSISVDSSKDTLGIKGDVKDMVKKAKDMTKDIEMPSRDDAYKAYKDVKKAIKIKKEAENLYDNLKVW